MKLHHHIRLSIPRVVLVVAMVSASVSRAEIISIPPSNVIASSEIPPGFNRQDDFIVDGSGFTGTTHGNGPPDGTMWLSTGTAFGGDDPDPSVTFDLGAVYTINSFQVWNYNELAGATDLTGRGVNGVTVLYGPTAALGSTVPGITNFARADSTATYAGEVFDGFAPFRAQFIRFDIDSNHGGDNNFYGLSEVRFDGLLSGTTISPDCFLTSASQGARVGDLTTPSGAAGDTFSYTLVAGEGDGDNAKFQIAGDELQIGPHDFSGAADGTEFSIRVRSAGSPSGEQIEAILTLTAKADSDADGLLDAWEQQWAGDDNLAALSGLGGSNADSDTLTDLEEHDLRAQFPGLNPLLADSDADTLEDGAEIAGAGARPPTDPGNADTDGDSLSDGVETNTGVFNGPSDTGSNPTLVDTDGDTYNDDIEVVRGSDPSDPNSTPPIGLVGYWPFDADADPQPDLSGFFNDAAVGAGAIWMFDNDRGSGVMDFDGNDSFLEAADSPSLSLVEDFTIAAWINPTDYSTDGDGAPFRGIVGKTEVNLPASYDLYLLANDGHARVLAGSPAGGWGVADNLTVPATGEWHHLAVSKIGTDVFFYYDGVADGQGTILEELRDSDATLRIGNRTDLVTDFLGRMDDVAIFDGGLSPAQVAAIMDGDFSDFGIGSANFAITDVVYDQAEPSVTITFTSRPGKVYAVDFSTDGVLWNEIDDGVDSEGATTTYTDTDAAGLFDTLLYRVREP